MEQGAQRDESVDEDLDEPDESALVTEDDTPLDSIVQEKQQRLLAACLHDSWPGPVAADGAPRPFVAMANVGLFFNPDEPPVVPDHLLSVDVALFEDLSQKKHRSYFVWRFGKPPDVVIEVVSNREGRELDAKRAIYERIRVAHYVVYDPLAVLGDLRVRVFELAGERYLERLDARFERLGLMLCEWEGRFEDHHGRWLRWADLDGNLLPTGRERADDERAQREQAQAQAADAQAQAADAQAQAEQAQAQAEQARARAERLAERLRALGLDPDEP